ncbi:MAG: NAD(P)-dependent glycerol-3-phosphate dehydrogenase [Betaproteobacteria bacterium]|nr:NAD(P)-dependent glycerol-3-phosphate dehydrogenase [Betaproteobacteria bacterium]NBT09973.1 NAD(P)-dependent glycerol-3-phosphate dehydrogenase [Betaproteobacteria bacterium]NBU50291.1 NAD(P)-dependent glycerol-3-phosphate dehydrogenase [Betaproteobacteria bacterium]NBX95858.1 NAD(P)-dependent glycerol-3-phosphate dehydrogenase [Betaproteobacteria bacterium]
MKIAVLGAGAWGTALALQAAARHDVLLWARDAQQVALMQRERVNARYLPGVVLPPSLALTVDLDAALAHAQQGLAVVGTPMSGLRTMLQAIAAPTPVLWLCKGLEAGTGLIGHELAPQVRPEGLFGVLSGPSFASEVARSQPTALVAASHDPNVLDRAVAAFHGDALRVYTSADPIGVEVGGAVKNVMAIATGVSDGLGLGLNARAALITRGLAEITRLGLALGARAETFMGLSGLGDLVLTATGDLSRNRRVGLALARGGQPAQILSELGHVSEGVYSARTIAQRAQALGVAMPITDAVVALLEGRLTPAQVVQQLLQREARAEG